MDTLQDKNKKKYLRKLNFILINEHVIIPPGYKKLVVFDNIHLKIKAEDKTLDKLGITEKDLLAFLISNEGMIQNLKSLISQREENTEFLLNTDKRRKPVTKKGFQEAYLCRGIDTEHDFERIYLKIDVDFALTLNIGDKIWFNQDYLDNVKNCWWVLDTQAKYEEWDEHYTVTDRTFMNDNTIHIRAKLTE